MNVRTSGVIRMLLVALAGVVVGMALPTLRGAEPAGSWDDYRILVDRNIFLRYRRRPVTRRAPTYTRRPEPRRRDADEDIVLTGVARLDGRYAAFFEDSQSGATGKVHVGQAIGEGKVVGISLEGVRYQRGGKVRKIEIGWTLTGLTDAELIERAGPAPPVPTTQPTSTTRPSDGGGGPESRPAGATSRPAQTPRPGLTPRPGGSSGTTGAGVGSILERMRRRREQELRR